MGDMQILYEYKDKGLQISHSKVHSTFRMKHKHYHEDYEIYYMLSGECNYFIKERTYSIKTGDLVFINRSDLHRTQYLSARSNERILINVEEEFLEEIAAASGIAGIFDVFKNNTNVLRFEEHKNKNLYNIIYKVIEESRGKEWGYEAGVKMALLDLLIFIRRHNGKYNTKEEAHPNPTYKKVSEVARYMNGNYMKDISLRTLSKEFFLSPWYLCRVFKEVTGFTCIEYLNYIRIKEAKALLKEHGRSVTEIAEKVGYDNVTHFGRVFKSITGIPPSKYRSLYK